MHLSSLLLCKNLSSLVNFKFLLIYLAQTIDRISIGLNITTDFPKIDKSIE